MRLFRSSTGGIQYAAWKIGPLRFHFIEGIARSKRYQIPPIFPYVDVYWGKRTSAFRIYFPFLFYPLFSTKGIE